MDKTAEQVKPSEPDKKTPIEERVLDIVKTDISLFFSGEEIDNFSLSRVWQNSMIRQAGDGLVDLPDGVSVVRAELRRVGEERGRMFKIIDFFYTGDTLLPLGTHASRDPNIFKAYQLDSNNNVTSELPLGDFLIDKLDQQVVLTRTLSEEEAAKYAKGSEELGSSYFPFWTDAIHTTAHNITDEFRGKGYEKAIKFILTRDELKSLLARKAVEVGTYDYLFPDRDPDSPFLFDFEIKFNREGFPLLVEGYNRWVNESGTPYIDNPFYRA